MSVLAEERDGATAPRGSSYGFDTLIDPQPWMSDALCPETDPEAFFPERGGSTREAKRICGLCAVRSDCLAYAVEHDERFGIWGGFSERERRRLKNGEQVTQTVTNKPNRRSNGHGHACKCLECRLLKATA